MKLPQMVPMEQLQDPLLDNRYLPQVIAPFNRHMKLYRYACNVLYKKITIMTNRDRLRVIRGEIMLHCLDTSEMLTNLIAQQMKDLICIAYHRN